MQSNLKNAFKFYRDLDHQHQAIDDLEGWLKENHPQQLEKFLQTWWSVPENEISLEDKDKPVPLNLKPLPHAENIDLHDAIIPGSSFTWADVVPHGERIPQDQAILDNIITLAQQLQVARDQIGKHFHITSWYHPQGYRVKSNWVTSEGHHAAGDAVEFWVEGYTGRQLADQLNWWPGGLGTYHYVPYIIHLNIGPHQRWQAPYPR